MKLFKDIDLTEEVVGDILNVDGVFAGETKEFKIFVYNDDKAYLTHLVFTVNHPEIEILEAPETLTPKEVGELIFKWSPTVTLDEPLKTPLKITGIRELRP